jgi:hypothetical protein
MLSSPVVSNSKDEDKRMERRLLVSRDYVQSHSTRMPPRVRYFLLIDIFIVWLSCNLAGWIVGARWNPAWDAAIALALTLAHPAARKRIRLGFLLAGGGAVLDFLRYPPDLIISLCTTADSFVAMLALHFRFFPASIAVAVGAVLIGALTNRATTTRLAWASVECGAMLVGMTAAMALVGLAPTQYVTGNALVAAMGAGMTLGLFFCPTTTKGSSTCISRHAE